MQVTSITDFHSTPFHSGIHEKIGIPRSRLGGRALGSHSSAPSCSCSCYFWTLRWACVLMRARFAKLRPLNFIMAAIEALKSMVELRSEIEKTKGYIEHLQEYESNLPAVQNLKCRIDSFSEDRG